MKLNCLDLVLIQMSDLHRLTAVVCYGDYHSPHPILVDRRLKKTPLCVHAQHRPTLGGNLKTVTGRVSAAYLTLMQSVAAENPRLLAEECKAETNKLKERATLLDIS